MESWDRLEDRIRVAFLRYAESLESLDDEDMQRLMRLLNVRLVAKPGRVLVTGVLDPSLFTTERTLAFESNWRYTVVLKPNPDRWPPKRKGSGQRKPTSTEWLYAFRELFFIGYRALCE